MQCQHITSVCTLFRWSLLEQFWVGASPGPAGTLWTRGERIPVYPPHDLKVVVHSAFANNLTWELAYNLLVTKGLPEIFFLVMEKIEGNPQRMVCMGYWMKMLLISYWWINSITSCSLPTLIRVYQSEVSFEKFHKYDTWKPRYYLFHLLCESVLIQGDLLSCKADIIHPYKEKFTYMAI